MSISNRAKLLAACFGCGVILTAGYWTVSFLNTRSMIETIDAPSQCAAKITEEFYKGKNKIYISNEYFHDAKKTEDIAQEAIDAFWEAQSQSCYLFGDYSVAVNVGNSKTSITREPFFDLETEEEMRKLTEKEANGIVAGLIQDGMSEREKAKALYDYVKLSAYDLMAFEALSSSEFVDKQDQWAEAVTAYGSLLSRMSVCQGDAQAFNLLARKAGLESELVTGKLGEISHAWNRVRCDGKWYDVDCCFELFCSSTEEYLAESGVSKVYPSENS